MINLQYTVRSKVFFPHNIFGSSVSSMSIEVTDDQWIIKPIKFISPVLVPNAVEHNIPPWELSKLITLANEQRFVVVTIIVDAQDDKQAWLISEITLDTFCSWLSFLTLTPYKIIEWLDAGTIDRNKLTIGISKSFTTPKDDSPIQSCCYNPPMDYDLSVWFTHKLPDGFIYSLRNFRKGLISERLEDKIMFWATAMEGISEILACQGVQVVLCENCGIELPRNPIASKDGLLNFVKDILGYSRTKIYEPIWHVRSKFIHSDIKGIKYSSEQLLVIKEAAEALLVIVASYYILTQTNLPFRDKSFILSDKYNYHHPFLGQLPQFKDHLEKLRQISIKL